MNIQNIPTNSGRKKLMILALCTLLLSLILLTGGIVMCVFAPKMASMTALVLMAIFGGLIIFCALIILMISIIMFITAFAMLKTFNSIKEPNLAKIGTTNVKLCKNCGSELDSDICSNCGKSQAPKICKCGAENDDEAKYCKKCGEKL